MAEDFESYLRTFSYSSTVRSHGGLSSLIQGSAVLRKEDFGCNMRNLLQGYRMCDRKIFWACHGRKIMEVHINIEPRDRKALSSNCNCQDQTNRFKGLIK